VANFHVFLTKYFYGYSGIAIESIHYRPRANYQFNHLLIYFYVQNIFSGD